MKSKKTITETETFSNTEIARLIESSQEKTARMIEDLALMVGRGLKEVHQKISDVDQRVLLTKEELSQKISSTNFRIDDLALNRVKYDNYEKLVVRVDKLESFVGQKKVK